MIKRLRPAMAPADLATVYATPHDHRRFGRGHGERVATTIELATTRAWDSAADLSCGNGAVLDAVAAAEKFYGDLAPGWPITGPLERTLTSLPDGGVDLYVMCETLEHLDDPGAVLGLVEPRARYLLLSTPVEAWDDSNGEHYWAWDRDGVEELVREAAPWCHVLAYETVDSRTYGEPYCYGIWLVRL